MKKNVLIFGLIAGSIVTALMIYASMKCYVAPEEFSGNDIMGYATMIVAFSFIFVGIKNYRDKYLQGIITFGQAFKIGMYITLIASTLYVGVWLIEYYVFIPDFIDHYAVHVLKAAEIDGATQAEIQEKTAEMDDYKEMYKNPVFVILISYAEIMPIGLIITLISALLLKRTVAK